MTSTAGLIVPGFNGGNPLILANFVVSPAMRSIGGGRTGRLADWSGSFSLDSVSLAQSLDDHLTHTFEEGHSAVSEIVEQMDGERYTFEGVSIRYSGGTNFTFRAFARNRTI